MHRDNLQIMTTRELKDALNILWIVSVFIIIVSSILSTKAMAYEEPEYTIIEKEGETDKMVEIGNEELGGSVRTLTYNLRQTSTIY